jgi:cardiolipin synthase
MTHEPQNPSERLLVGGSAAYGRMWQLIDDGLESIELETCILKVGLVGDEFLRRLTALRESFERMWDLAPFGRAEVRAFWLKRPRVSNAAPEVPQLLLSGPGCPTAELRRQLVADLRRSRRFRGWAAYFLPSRRVGAAIREAARRGDAAIMLGTRSDVPLSLWASERLFSKYLGAGLRIYRYRAQIVHAKALVVVDVVYVGSANLDVRSLLINYELLLRIPSRALAEALRQRFGDDVTRAGVLDAQRWRGERRWWQTLRSYIAHLLLARFDPYLATRNLSSLR